MQATRLPRHSLFTLALACALAGAGVTRAQAQDAHAGHAYGVQMNLAIHGQNSAPRLIVEEGKPFAVAGESAGKPWRAEFVLKPTGEPKVVRVAGKISEGGATLTEPVLIGKLGERMGIKVGDDVQLAFVVNEQKRAD